MTAFDRFDHRLAASLDDLAAPTYPDYCDDVLEQATRRAQRPAWTFLERWLPMSTVTRRNVFAPTFPYRTVMLLLAVLALLIAAMAISFGMRPDLKPAPPFGRAANGTISYSIDGDIYARELGGGAQRLLVGGPARDINPTFSRDGTRLAFFRVTDDPAATATDSMLVANADGTDARVLIGPTTIVTALWSPDSTELAVITEEGGHQILSIVGVAQAAAPRTIDLPVNLADEVDWRPPDGDELIFRGEQGSLFAIYAIRPDGSGFRQITGELNSDHFWGTYALSPDGKELAYVNGGDRVETHVLNLDSGEDRLWGAALPPFADGFTGLSHWGSPVYSADGTRFVFGRYWGENDGTLNHQVFVATVASDGADAVPIGEVHRSQSGHNPFGYGFAPDDTAVLIQDIDVLKTWLADPAGGDPQPLDWGELLDPPTWQRLPPSP